MIKEILSSISYINLISYNYDCRNLNGFIFGQNRFYLFLISYNLHNNQKLL